MDSFFSDACPGRCSNLKTTIEPLNNGGIEYRWMSPPPVSSFFIRLDPETGGKESTRPPNLLKVDKLCVYKWGEEYMPWCVERKIISIKY
jgi:hypothetical protein